MRGFVCALSLSVFLFTGCSEWDDFIDSITGSDDEPAKTATTTTTQAPASPTTSSSSTSTSSSSTSSSGTTKKESGAYAGRYNGDRPTWRWGKRMASFPKTFTLYIPGCYDGVTVANNGWRVETRGIIIKQSDVHPGMAVVAPSSCHSRTAYVQYKN